MKRIVQVTYATKNVLLALQYAWEQFRTQFADKPAYVVMNEQTWLQFKLCVDHQLIWEASSLGAGPHTFQGVPIVITKTLAAALEFVGTPGSLFSVALTWAEDEKR